MFSCFWLLQVESCDFCKAEKKEPRSYSSVPNRRAVQNKRAGGKILKKH